MDPKLKRLAPIAIRLTRDERQTVLKRKLRHESVGQCIRRLALVAASHLEKGNGRPAEPVA